MADGVDAAVQAKEPTAPDPQLDRPFSEPGGPQLLGRHDAMLARGQRRHGRITASVKKPFA